MGQYLPTIISAVISVIISGTLGFLIKRSFENYFNKKEQSDLAKEKAVLELQKYRDAEERMNRLADYKAVAAEVMQPVADKVNTIAEKVNKLEDQMADVSDATILSLRVDMKTLKDRFKKQGFADTGDKAMWNELYDKYKHMGGNHFKEYVNKWKEEVEKLPEE